jgi:flagella basal body P-ring formation protein FlgA
MKFSPSALVLILSVLLVEDHRGCLQAGEIASLQLRPSAQVDGEGVFIDQVVQGTRAVPHLRLCAAPAFGKTLSVNRAQVTDLLITAGQEVSLTNWTGAESIRVSRRSRSLAEADLLPQLTSLLQAQQVKDRGELELRCTRPWTAILVPDEALTFKVLDLPTAGVTPSFILRFQILTANGEDLGSFQTVLQAKILREVWVARSTVRRGETLGDADLGRDRRDLLTCRDALAEFDRENSKLEFSENISAGTPIPARALKPRTVVHRGQLILAVVQDGALAVSMKVEALEDGAIGQTIRARNPNSRKDLQGKILNDQNLLVQL